MILSKEAILMGRDSEYPLSIQLEKNLSDLYGKINLFLDITGFTVGVSSGYRPGKYNEKYSKHSAHLTCEAVDLIDRLGIIKRHILKNQHILEQCDLYMESPFNEYVNRLPYQVISKYSMVRCETWVHLDTRYRVNRIFIP